MINKTVTRNRWTRGLGRGALAVLLLALAWAVVDGRSDAQPPLTVRVLGPTSPVSAGQAFSVAVTIENVQNLGAFEFEYNFDSSVASAGVTGIQLDAMLGSTGRTTGVLRLASAPGQPGVPLFGAYSYGEASGPNGNGVLATVTMTALSPGVSQLSLSELKVTNIAGDQLLATTAAGSVTVVAATQRSIYMPLLRRNSGN